MIEIKKTSATKYIVFLLVLCLTIALVPTQSYAKEKTSDYDYSVGIPAFRYGNNHLASYDPNGTKISFYIGNKIDLNKKIVIKQYYHSEFVKKYTKVELISRIDADKREVFFTLDPKANNKCRYDFYIEYDNQIPYGYPEFAYTIVDYSKYQNKFPTNILRTGSTINKDGSNDIASGVSNLIYQKNSTYTVYNGKRRPIHVYTLTDEQFKITVYYEGTKFTPYKKSTTAPKDYGIYHVSALVKSKKYDDTIMDLGEYRIVPPFPKVNQTEKKVVFRNPNPNKFKVSGYKVRYNIYPKKAYDKKEHTIDISYLPMLGWKTKYVKSTFNIAKQYPNRNLKLVQLFVTPYLVIKYKDSDGKIKKKKVFGEEDWF